MANYFLRLVDPVGRTVFQIEVDKGLMNLCAKTKEKKFVVAMDEALPYYQEMKEELRKGNKND
jgi:hypothetical protein